MSEKIFNGPEDLVVWFKENPDMLGPIPWGSNLIAHQESAGRGCNCKKKSKLINVERVYTDLVINIFKENANFANILKKEIGVDSITFLLNGEELAKI